MIGKRSVTFSEQADRINAKRAHQLRRNKRTRAVPAIIHDTKWPTVGVRERTNALGDVGDVAINDFDVRQLPCTTRESATNDQLVQRLNFGAMQRAGADTHLEAVVLGGIVRPCDLNATNDRLMVQRPVQKRRRNDTDVDDVHSALRQPAHQGIAQRVATRPIVATNRHGAADSLPGEICRISSADTVCNVYCEIATNDAADIILAKNCLTDRHGGHERRGRVGAA